ncbi:MAG: hypothetical protein LGR52_02545 [Candidatus Thiosymbion ectosymbiont of Robbea hypermnestra]|nr:hypothetical protein [Candidatus Thiosymbion ectosymbiont of Robbea hypermnestra]
MSKTSKLASLSVALVLSVGLLGGCATDKRRTTATTLEDAAQKANTAQMCCEANRDRIERLHEKSMYK